MFQYKIDTIVWRHDGGKTQETEWFEDAATFEACPGRIVRLSSSRRHPILQLCSNLKALIVDFVTCVSECFAFVHHGSAPRRGQKRETGGDKSKTRGQPAESRDHPRPLFNCQQLSCPQIWMRIYIISSLRYTKCHWWLSCNNNKQCRRKTW